MAADGTIHLLARFVRARAKGVAPPEAVPTALDAAGRVMLTTTLPPCAGLAVTGFGAFAPVRLFGAMMALGLGAALLAAPLVPPAFFLSKGSRLAHP